KCARDLGPNLADRGIAFKGRVRVGGMRKRACEGWRMSARPSAQVRAAEDFSRAATGGGRALVLQRSRCVLTSTNEPRKLGERFDFAVRRAREPLARLAIAIAPDDLHS